MGFGPGFGTGFGPGFARTEGESGVAVPDVVGSDQATGTAALEAALFVVAVQSANSSIFAAGDIMSQSPAGGVDAPEGSTVTITVSLGEASSDGDFILMARRRRRR